MGYYGDVSVGRARQPPEWIFSLIRGSVLAFSALGGVAIVSTRLHYTIDVFIALYVTHRSWTVYHNYLRYVINRH